MGIIPPARSPQVQAFDLHFARAGSAPCYKSAIWLGLCSRAGARSRKPKLQPVRIGGCSRRSAQPRQSFAGGLRGIVESTGYPKVLIFPMNPEPPPNRSSRPSGRIALAIYLPLSTLFFARGLLGHFSDRLIGVGPDPALFVFFLTWSAYAALHHLNPFITHSIWAPQGFNLAWSTFVPLAGIVAAPITLLAGPVPAYNLAMLLCPALSAWTAFLLCRQICGRFWPSLAGGYVYGFSAYMLSHMLGHLTLVMAFFPPLAIYLVLRRIAGVISARRFAILLTLVLIGQIGSSLEMLAILTVFGAIALALEWLLGSLTTRAQLNALIVPIGSAYLIALIVAIPYLYYFFALAGTPRMATDLAILGVVTPANLTIPSPVNALGTFAWARALSKGQNIYETSAYIGLPMIFLMWNLVRSQRRNEAAQLAVLMFAMIYTASFGPQILVGGKFAVPMPWKAFTYLPLLDKAEPARFALFGFLCLGIIFALWLANDFVRARVRTLIAAITLIFMLPNLVASYWVTPADTPAFFASGRYRQYLAPNDNVLILPYGLFGNVDLWQSDCWMSFRTAGGYVGLSPAVPIEYQPWPIVYALYNLAELPDLTEQVNSFLVQKQIKAVIVADGGAHLWGPVFDQGPLTFRQRPFNADEQAVIHAMFSALDPSPIKDGGVTLYRIPLAALASYAHTDPSELERRAAAARLTALITAAYRYLRQGGDPSQLNPSAIARLGLIPKLWLSGPNTEGVLSHYMIQNGLALAVINGAVMVGIRGSFDVLRDLTHLYSGQATKISIFPPMLSFSPAEQTQYILLMTFDRDQLSRVVEAQVRDNSPGMAN